MHAIRVSCVVVCVLLLTAASAAPHTAPSTRAASRVEATPSNSADTKRANEYKLKAAFLYNFCLFTTWPKEAFEKDDSPMVVGILGNDPFGATLDAALKQKKVGQRPFRIERYANVHAIGNCHVLFVPTSSVKRMPEVIKKLEGRHTLIVGESKGFAHSSGAIGFYIEKKKMRFEVNTAEAKLRGLTISSKLLKLARIVKEKK